MPGGDGTGPLGNGGRGTPHIGSEIKEQYGVEQSFGRGRGMGRRMFRRLSTPIRCLFAPFKYLSAPMTQDEELRFLEEESALLELRSSEIKEESKLLETHASEIKKRIEELRKQ